MFVIKVMKQKNIFIYKFGKKGIFKLMKRRKINAFFFKNIVAKITDLLFSYYLLFIIKVRNDFKESF